MPTDRQNVNNGMTTHPKPHRFHPPSTYGTGKWQPPIYFVPPAMNRWGFQKQTTHPRHPNRSMGCHHHLAEPPRHDFARLLAQRLDCPFAVDAFRRNGFRGLGRTNPSRYLGTRRTVTATVVVSTANITPGEAMEDFVHGSIGMDATANRLRRSTGFSVNPRGCNAGGAGKGSGYLPSKKLHFEIGYAQLTRIRIYGWDCM